ncbi:succinylglutamate desuccinylase/aspartoacylase family protein [Algoriphagus sp.]|jgi:predicted deacylase|uniref:succinylglutamate desuccinylase/aspartoacylase family protein n=1 Tax=Algoriphagus sp. TaxID=1872435 RepID=UPI002727D6D4|nr:succinylglutamate desuccinylase/aspartoacylase family protein [Algoriphagus sp.]MDO8968180.1 succinylglutamate desuccinylase/aspartoacylase family protein [Algoriphagus sp.]MDP3202281.1 succinylglutamate desuccinylase/aspartoacylase family protein [Algoriphagus sp.]
MKEVLINGVRIRPGQSVNIELPIAKLPTHTLIDLPIFIRSAKEEGPTVLVSGGIHGDEINGIFTAKRILEEIDAGLEILKGTLIIIPLVNIYGFLSNSRTFPDGRDLNRSFPGSNKGSLASRIAYILNEEIIPQIDYGIDFHTGGRMLSNEPQVRVDFKDKVALELAKAFGTNFVVNSKHIEKSFRKTAFNARKHLLVYEGGESMRLDHHAIAEGIIGTKRLLHHLQMINSPQPSPHTLILKESEWTRGKASGIFFATVKLGESIKKGQLIANISDPYGQVIVPVKANTNGYVIGLNNNPVVNVGDALIHIGKE